MGYIIDSIYQIRKEEGTHAEQTSMIVKYHIK